MAGYPGIGFEKTSSFFYYKSVFSFNGENRMALKGNLSDFPIIQIMNLVSLARKSGSLVIQHEGQAFCIVL